jgi:hypothetical protein
MRWLVLPLALLVFGAVALVAGDGSDDETTVTTETQTTVESRDEPVVSPRVKIRRTLEEWAPLFAAAANTQSCQHMIQPVCERIACERVGNRPIKNCTPPSSAYRKSFEGVTVVDVVIVGLRAAATFSNGQPVELVRVSANEPGGVWWISKIGGNAGRKLFEEG